MQGQGASTAACGRVRTVMKTPRSNLPASIRIRPARASDCDALLALENASFNTDQLTRRRLRHWIKAANGILLVAAGGGEVYGYVLVLTRRDSRNARLYSLAIAAHARGLGLGGRLLRSAQQRARAAGCTGLRLEVSEGNSAALALYGKLGYERFARLPGYYENGENALRMRKALV